MRPGRLWGASDRSFSSSIDASRVAWLVVSFDTAQAMPTMTANVKSGTNAAAAPSPMCAANRWRIGAVRYDDGQDEETDQTIEANGRPHGDDHEEDQTDHGHQVDHVFARNGAAGPGLRGSWPFADCRVFAHDERSRCRSGGLECSSVERLDAEHAVEQEADGDDHNYDATLGVAGESAERAVESGGLVGVDEHRRP